MCSKTTCQKCDKPTWRGCGNHVEEALAGVPKNQRCSCASGAASELSEARGARRSRWRGR